MSQNITKELLMYFLKVGTIYVAASSPYFARRVLKEIFKEKYDKQKFSSSFSYLKRKNLVEIKKENHDVKIYLTKEGEKRAKKYHINDLTIKKPKKWDQKWRIIIFDVSQSNRLIRDIFREKIKELNFYCLQKSVWVCPYPCEKEINILKEFLGVSTKDIRIIIAQKIEDDGKIRKFFKL